MSRIDQALSRSHGSAVPPPAPAGAEGLASPWQAGDEHADHGEPKPHPLPERNGLVVGLSRPASRVRREPIVGRFTDAWKERLTTWPDAQPALVEQYRRLVAALFERQLVGNLRSLVVTSPSPDDGKTLTALNLALVFSESYHRSVLLIDGDLRRPTIGDAAGLKTVNGLNEAIAPREDRTVSLVQVSEHLSLLPASGPDPDPVSGLTSPRMRQLLEDAGTKFEWVIVDSPPTGVAADAGLLASMVDGAILVVRAGVTPYPAIQQAVESIGRDRIVGVVLNAVEDGATADYESYYGVAGRP